VKMHYSLFSTSAFLGTILLLSIAGSARNLQEDKLSAVALEFRERLGISEPVLVSLTEVGDRLVSVQRTSNSAPGFLIKFDRNFHATLTEEEVRAAIAHEMGHVWIFTHHPYLHTEPLANEKARELVSPEGLAKIYEKVWKKQGHKGSLEALLGKVPNP